MKKDIEWLKEGVGDLPITDTVFISDGLSYIDSAVSVMSVYDLIDQLEESEVPKQELPVIPKYVADFIESRKHTYANTFQYILQIAMGNSESPRFNKEYDWIRQSVEVFARAWLDGFTVEEEQKYYVINNENYFLLGKDKAHGFVFSTGGNSRLGGLKTSSANFELSEQEIKDYDERYWAFAKPVE